MDKFTLLKYFLIFKEPTAKQYKLYQIFYSLVGVFAATTLFVPYLTMVSAIILFLLVAATLYTNNIMIDYKPISENNQLWKIGTKQFVGTENQAIVYSVLECNDAQPEFLGHVIHYK